jgi:hypothetical protein
MWRGVISPILAYVLRGIATDRSVRTRALPRAGTTVSSALQQDGRWVIVRQ